MGHTYCKLKFGTYQYHDIFLQKCFFKNSYIYKIICSAALYSLIYFSKVKITCINLKFITKSLSDFCQATSQFLRKDDGIQQLVQWRPLYLTNV